MTVEAISEEDWLILTLNDFIDLHNNAFATSANSNQTASAFHLFRCHFAIGKLCYFYAVSGLA